MRWIGALGVALLAACGSESGQPGADGGVADVVVVPDVAISPDQGGGEPDVGAQPADDGDAGCGGCVVGDACLDDGAPDPADPCRICAADGKGGTLVAAADGAPCTAAHACVVALCKAGECTGEPRDCDDGDGCTADSCIPASGCSHAPVDGSCEDGDACTIGDSCEGGACVGGGPADCDDGHQCTADACDAATGCAHLDADGAPCDDGDACTEDEACQGGACLPAIEELCDDGDPCTADACNPFSGCVHLPTDGACDDGDPCTADSCKGGGCEHSASADGAPCEDGNACTVGDACAAGGCVPGGGALPCDDGNPCTLDGCAPGTGCVVTVGPEGVPCDDGVACTQDDACQGSGKCKGTPVDCGPCVPTFEPTSMVASNLLIGADGHPTNGLDVDLDPLTCAPAGSCSAGIDNAAALLGTLINDNLGSAVQSGDVAYLMELDWPLGAPVGPFALSIYVGEPSVPGCAPGTGACSYLVYPTMVDTDTCSATTLFGNATYEKGMLAAGGPSYTFPLSLPIVDGANIEITMYAAALYGKLVTSAGGKPSTFAGVIGGAVRQDEFFAALYAIPPWLLILPADQLVGLVETLLTLDMDTDGDGAKDAYSVGFKVNAVAAPIVGVLE